MNTIRFIPNNPFFGSNEKINWRHSSSIMLDDKGGIDFSLARLMPMFDNILNIIYITVDAD